MNVKVKDILTVAGLCVMALAIPGLLILNAVQARKYTALQKEVLELEEKQEQLVVENNKLITDISLLSSSDRIEKIAQEQLGMRPAESEEILRIRLDEKKQVGQGSQNEVQEEPSALEEQAE